MKADKDYLIGTEVIIETDCLPILGMVSGCAMPDLAMLRWIVYIRSLHPEIRHFSRKDNAMADMLSRARFKNEDDMVSEDEEVGVDFFEAAYMTTRKGGTPALNDFDESKYDGEWLQIGGFLRTMTPDASRPTGSGRKHTDSFFGTDTYGSTRRRGTESRSGWWR